MTNPTHGRAMLANCMVEADLAASEAIERTLGTAVPPYLRGELFWHFKAGAPAGTLPAGLGVRPSAEDDEGEEAAFAGAVAIWCGGLYYRSGLELTAFGRVAGIDLAVNFELNPDFPDEHEASLAYQVNKKFSAHARATAEDETRAVLNAEAKSTIEGIEAQAREIARDADLPCAAHDLAEAVRGEVNRLLIARLGAGYRLNADGTATVPVTGSPVALLSALRHTAEEIEPRVLFVEHSCDICQPQ